MLYYFKLGHQKDISTAELNAVFSNLNISGVREERGGDYLILQTKEKLDAEKLINRLGGTVKIGAHIETEDENLLRAAARYLLQVKPRGKIVFSLSGKNHKKNALRIKKMLKEESKSVRYVEPKNTATIL